MSRHRFALERLRAQLASVKMVQLEPATIAALDDALSELDAMIAEEASADTLPATFDLERFATDLCMGVVQ